MELIEKALKICKEKEKEKEYSELETISNQILKVDPNNLPSKYFLAISKKKLEKKEEYNEIFNEIKNIESNNSCENTILGTICFDLEEAEESLKFYKKAIKLDPNNDDAWSKLGNHYRILKKYKKAISCLKKSYKINDKNEESLLNLSVCYIETKKINKTIKNLKKINKINKKSNIAKFNLGCAYLLNNNFKQGWKYYNYRIKKFSYFKEFPKEKKLLGKKINNEKILFIVEQGIGDIINFIRFTKIFKEKYPNCETKIYINKYYTSSFIDLIKNNFENIIEDLPEDYDYWCSVVDIPQYLKLNKKEIKNSYTPCIKTNKICDYSHFNGMYKIGICWAGNAAHPRDELRSCRLSLFKDINKIPNVKLFSLQKDLRLRKWPFNNEPIDLADNCSDMRLVNMSPYMNTWEETASIINGLDLVITVDTSILHLSGALGKKTFAILQYSPDWRWGLNSKNTIWYPNTTLFRQKKINDWNYVFKDLYENVLLETKI